MNFTEKVVLAAQSNSSLVCVGLDPDPNLMPQMDLLDFNKAIIDATSDIVCAYKPNLAFYEAMGIEGITALQKTVDYIKAYCGNIPVIGDAKRGDIGNTARAYARSLFDNFGFDAVTVNPYMGYDSIEPFLSYKDKGVFILCRTSNTGAGDIQDVTCCTGESNKTQPLYKIVAQKAREWNKQGNIALVVGATCPDELKEIRALCPDMVFLIPGIGAQGGDLVPAVKYGVDINKEKALFNSSRQILYASKGKDFALKGRLAADELRREINVLRLTK